MEEASILALESIYLISEEKTGTRHVKMAQIDNKTKQMKRMENNDIKNYASKIKQNANKGKPQ